MTDTVDTSACRLCLTQAPHPEDPSGVLRRCRSCDFTWTIAEIASPAELYDAEYFAGTGYEDYFQPAARRYEANLRLRWLLASGPIGSLVEAGSAAGFFVEAATAAGIRAQGIEVCDAAAGYARETLGMAVSTGCFESESLDETFDVVCAFHVLEHVEEPLEFLAAARQAVRPGGRIALEVPNVESAAAHRMGTAWPGLQPEYHRWHFGPDSLTRLVRQAGFEIVTRDTTVFRYYMPPRYRRRQGRNLIPADVRNLRSIRLTHSDRGDLLRLIARRPDQDRNPDSATPAIRRTM